MKAKQSKTMTLKRRFGEWVGRLTGSAAAMSSATAGFEEVDQYYFVLRVGATIAAVVWAMGLAAAEVRTSALFLALTFAAYSLLLYLFVWKRPESTARAYLAVLPADLVFLFFVCLWSAEPMSGVYLAFYLLVALHAFYFGARVGILAASGFSLLYVFVFLSLPPAERVSLEELAERLIVAFLVGISLGLASYQLRAHRRSLASANRQLQQRNRVLEQTYRSLSIGRLAGDVAHHINNPAAAIVAKVDLLRRRATRDGLAEPYLRDLATIAEHAFRISKVTHSLGALSQQHEAEDRSVDVAAVAEGVALLFERRVAEKRVRLERRLTHGVRVRGSENALRQVLVNLLANALDAVEEGGQVVIETVDGSDPDTVELCVRDDGPGIPAGRLDDVFSPFFTTKNGAQGVGLGLSLSLAMVKHLGGTIAVDSGPGHGTTFTVTLPAAADSSHLGAYI